jgi:hypothetical protein
VDIISALAGCCKDNTFFFTFQKNRKALRLGDWKIRIKINAMTLTATIPRSDILLDQNAHFPSFEGAVQTTGLYMYP